MDSILVNLTKRLCEFSGTKLGINVNYITDGIHLDHSPRNLRDGLKDLGVKYLRYPGGEKSDGYLWSTPPYEKPRPTLARTGQSEMREEFLPYTEADYKTLKPCVMDFDQFMQLCKELECEPYVVVCYDSMFIPPQPGGSIPTREQLYETACAWVRYANVEKGYGIRYWEIGNESYVLAHNNGARVDDYVRDIEMFARGMKAIDPQIKILANGPTGLDANETPWGRLDADTKKPWWPTLLPAVSKWIDGIAFHDYPCFAWESYDYYAQNDVSFADPVVDHLLGIISNCCSKDDASRMMLALTETHSADWSTGKPGIERPGWSLDGTWGHALVLFDMLGKYLCRKEVSSVLVWNTRWVEAVPDTVSKRGGLYDFWDTLDVENNLLPPGRMIKLWNDNLLDCMVDISGAPGLSTFASADHSGSKLRVFLINKGYQQRSAEVILPCEGFILKDSLQVSGSGADDPWPEFRRTKGLVLHKSSVVGELPPVSLTVLSFQK